MLESYYKLQPKLKASGGGLRATYDVHLRLTRTRVVDFLLVLIGLFRYVLQLRRYERKQIENRRFASIRRIFT